MSSVLVGMFDTQNAANDARSKLLSVGFTAANISMTGGDSASPTLSSAGSGSTTPHAQGSIASFFSSLFDSDESPNRSAYTDTYGEAFKRGSFGVSVTAANDTEMEKAEKILNAAGAVDIDERSQQWRTEGSTGTAGAMAGAGTTLEAGTTRKLQEVEEELKVGKRSVVRGGVRIFSRVMEVPVSESVRLREEHANVQRRTVDRPATEADFAAFKEGSIEVRETAEEAVVSKSARVVGEVEIGKTSSEREEVIQDTVRKTKVEVEQIDGGKTAGGSVKTSMGTTGMSATGSANLDPLTGAPGAHPVGTGVGAAAGGIAAGAAAGSVAGPVGTVVGAAIGAVAGGMAGKGVAETVDPTVDSNKTKKPF